MKKMYNPGSQTEDKGLSSKSLIACVKGCRLQTHTSLSFSTYLSCSHPYFPDHS